jgi:hypothetical protein
MPPEGFEPAIPASERPQTHALYRAVTAIGQIPGYYTKTDGDSHRTLLPMHDADTRHYIARRVAIAHITVSKTLKSSVRETIFF